MTTDWTDTLHDLHPHDGGRILRRGYPTDATFDAWMSRASGTELAELIDLLDDNGTIAVDGVLDAAGIRLVATHQSGRAARVVTVWIESQLRGVVGITTMLDAFDRLDADAGNRLRMVSSEIREAWALFEARAAK